MPRRSTLERAIDIIIEYKESTGRNCFTYEDIMRFWRQASIPIKAESLTRRIRELARTGFLERRSEGGRRIFCLRTSEPQ